MRKVLTNNVQGPFTFDAILTVFSTVFFQVFVLSEGIPVPEEAAAAPLLLPYAYPGLVAYPYAVPVYPNINHTGVHYPFA